MTKTYNATSSTTYYSKPVNFFHQLKSEQQLMLT
jgi:hypothetical protein